MTVPPVSLEVLMWPGELPESALRDQQVVVIDVLRATTVIGVALAAGAGRIIPAPGIEEALALKAQIDPDGALLCGERAGRPIPGFDLGNSPAEYRPRRVRGRTLILASTNGSVALARSQAARRVLAASFNTLGAVARSMAATGGTWIVICSGKAGRPCLEDLACAGGLAARLGGVPSSPVETDPDQLDAASDGTRIALELYQRHAGDVPALLRSVAHGRYLSAIGYDADLAVAAAVDTLDLVPELADGRLVAAPPAV